MAPETQNSISLLAGIFLGSRLVQNIEKGPKMKFASCPNYNCFGKRFCTRFLFGNDKTGVFLPNQKKKFFCDWYMFFACVSCRSTR